MSDCKQASGLKSAVQLHNPFPNIEVLDVVGSDQVPTVESDGTLHNQYGPAVLECDIVQLSNTMASGQLSSDKLNGIHGNASSIHFWDFDSGRIKSLAYGYTQISETLDIHTVPIYCRDSDHKIGGLYSQLNKTSWLHELSYETDSNIRDYLQFGILNGFYIVNPDEDVESYICENYASVLKGDAHSFVDSLLKDELSYQKYIITEQQPHCVHALGAVPKGDGTYRPITDCNQIIACRILGYNFFVQFY